MRGTDSIWAVGLSELINEMENIIFAIQDSVKEKIDAMAQPMFITKALSLNAYAFSEDIRMRKI